MAKKVWMSRFPSWPARRDPYRLPIPMLWKTRRITDKMARNLWIAYILSIPLKSFSKSRDRVANIKVHDKVVKARPGVTKFVMPVANQM